MSLIFSALSEIDRKQAEGGGSDSAFMRSAGAERGRLRPMVLLAVAAAVLIALVAAAYALLHQGAPAAGMAESGQPPTAAAGPVASHAVTGRSLASQHRQPSIVPLAAPGAAVASAPAAEPVVSATPPQADPPYALRAQPEATTPPAARHPQVRIIGNDSRRSQSAPDEVSAATGGSGPAAAAQKPDSAAATAALAAARAKSPVSTTPRETPARAPARNRPPARHDVAARDDAPTIGDNNFIKVGRQAPAQPSSEDAVGNLVAGFRAAMARGEHDAARAALAKLGQRLSPRSLTLLRMQAWYAVDSGDDDTARQRYGRLLQRLPDDINAGVNLALIEWRAGQHAAALQRINHMYTQHPDSDLVKRNWRVMHRQRQ